MKVNEVFVKNILVKSNLKDVDFVINPYVGCPHACMYCYASFMKKFTNHSQNWGSFIDVKICNSKLDVNKIKNKNIFLSSVTDCYNEYEGKYKITRQILEQLKNVSCNVTISTKSKLILRDLDILKNFHNIKVCVSINTLNEKFKNDMDKASCIKDRLKTLKELHKNNIHTVLFMSPIFPEITEWKEIIEFSKDFVDEYWFEDLKLRGDYKFKILNYILKMYPQYYLIYDEIYNQNKDDYWNLLAPKIKDFCLKYCLNFNIFFDKKANNKISNKQLNFFNNN